MKKILLLFLTALALSAAGGYVYIRISADPGWIGRITGKPCWTPIEYSIGSADDRFGLSKDEIKEIIILGAAAWEKAAGKKLFAYTEGRGIAINLIYDSRQESSDELKKLGLNIKDDQESYDLLKTEYESIEALYEREKTALDNETAGFDSRKTAYEKKVSAWNSKGGAPPDEFKKLEIERKNISTQAQAINGKIAGLNETGKQVNALAHSLNMLAQKLNLKVKDYNTVGEARSGKEFQEGVYRENGREKTIDIYQFDTKTMLARVLAHELGHALGLEHTDDPQDIMYRLNEGKNVDISENDAKALKAICSMPLFRL